MQWQQRISGFDGSPQNQAQPLHRGWRPQAAHRSLGICPSSCSWTTPQHAHARHGMAPGAIQVGAREPDADETSATTRDRDGRP